MSSEHLHYKVEAAPFNKVDPFIPTSKSYGNRLLVLASLYGEEVIIKRLPESTDVLTMIACLKQIGLKISGDLNKLIISNSFPQCESHSEEDVHLRTGDGGTTNRFLMGLVSLGKKKYYFHPTERISTRPVDQFIAELSQFNVKISKEKQAWLSIQGPLNVVGESIAIDCSKSTQFATALQMVISPLDKIVNPINMHSSAKYFEITKNLCEIFQNGEREHTVPLDFSSFCYPVALATCSGKLTLNDFSGIDSYQPDGQFVEIIKKMGTIVTTRDGFLEVVMSELNAIDLDCSDFPDLVPTLAFICSYAKGNSCLKRIKVLKHKESDRIYEVLKILKAFDVECSYDENNAAMTIVGRGSMDRFIDLETAKDHRMIMVAYLFMRMNGGGVVHHVGHIDKSYPTFFESMIPS